MCLVHSHKKHSRELGQLHHLWKMIIKSLKSWSANANSSRHKIFFKRNLWSMWDINVVWMHFIQNCVFQLTFMEVFPQKKSSSKDFFALYGRIYGRIGFKGSAFNYDTKRKLEYTMACKGLPLRNHPPSGHLTWCKERALFIITFWTITSPVVFAAFCVQHIRYVFHFPSCKNRRNYYCYKRNKDCGGSDAFLDFSYVFLLLKLHWVGAEQNEQVPKL